MTEQDEQDEQVCEPSRRAPLPRRMRSVTSQRGRLSSTLLDPRFWQAMLVIAAGAMFLKLAIEAAKPPTETGTGPDAVAAAAAAEEPRVCERPSCVLTAAQTVRFLNRSVDPCHNFFHYACGRFSEAHPSGTRSALGVRDVLSRQNRARLLQLLRQRQDYHSSSAVSKARLFFSTCLHAYHASLNSVPSLVQLLRPLGGLDLFATWQPHHWSFNGVLANTSSLHLTQAFFTSTWDREHGIVELKLPKLALDFSHDWAVGGSRYRTVQARVGRTMREVFHQLEHDSGVLLGNKAAPRACGLNRTSCVDEIVDDVISVQGELLAINPKKTHPAFLTPPVRVTLAEMRRLVPQIDWRRLLDSLFGTGAVADDVQFQVPSREHMAAVGRLIDGTRVKRLHHFLMWPVIRRYLVALGPVYATLGEELDRNYNAEKLQTREEQCLALLDEHMAPALHALLLTGHIGQQSATHVRQHLLKDAFRLLNDSFSWMSEDTQRNSRAALESLTVKFGFTELISNQRALDEYYAPLNFHVQKFFDNLRELYDFNRPGKIVDEFPSKALPESVKIRHDIARATLWVPFGALQAPWYHPDLPARLNAAALGSLIFEALAVPFIQIHLSPQNLTDLWDRETEWRFEQYYNCLLDKIRQRPIRQEHAIIDYIRGELNFTPYKMKIDPVPATYYMMADQFAYQLSYRLYHQLEARDPEPYTVLPGLSVTNASQAFFLAFTQARCRNDYALWDESLVGASNTLQVPESYVINHLVLDDPRFREAFQCGPLPAKSSDREASECSLF